MDWRSSTLQWKVALAAFSIAVGLMDAWALFRAPAAFSPEARGSLAAELGDSQRGWFRVRSVEDRSPLAAAGIKAGDEVRFDHSGDGQRILGVGETIGLAVRGPTGTRHLGVTTVPEPVGPQEMAALAMVIPGSLLMLAMGTLIGWRGADSIALRALSASLLSQTLHFATPMLPGGALQSFLAEYPSVTAGAVAYVAFMYFALAYARWPLLGERRGRLAYWIYVAVFVAYDALSIARRDLPGLASMLPSLRGFGTTLALFSAAFSTLVLVIGWRRAHGLRRERLGWIVACLGAIDAAYFGENLGQLSRDETMMFVADIVAGALVSAGNVGLAYAVLRYRVLDFGFAINRAVVYGTTSLLLAGAFMLASQILNRVLQFDAREDHRILDMGIGLGLALTARQAVRWVDPRVQRIFFRKWHAAAAKLAAFRVDALQVKDARALRIEFLEAVREYVGASKIGFYLADGAGALRRSECIGPDLPETIPASDPLVAALATASSGVEPRRVESTVDAVLCLPMTAHGRLLGTVLVGPKPDDEPFRPDERKQLAHTAQQVGLALELARLGALEAKLAAPTPPPPTGRKRKAKPARTR